MNLKSLLLFLAIIYCLPAFGQTNSFTGLIIYDYQFQNPVTGEDISEQMAHFLGKEQHYYINDHSYKSYNENGNLGQLYNSKTNKYYFVNPGSGQLMELDAANSSSEKVSVHHLDETETILGMQCKKLTVKTESSETTYWYSPQIKVNRTVYENHHFGDWATYMNASSGALPLKFVVKNQNYTWTSTARELKEMEFTEDDFDLEKIEGEN